MKIFGNRNKVAKKPSIEISDKSIIRVPEYGLDFNIDIIGQANFKDLKNSDYGNGFNMASFPNLVKLVYATHLNKEPSFQPDSGVRELSQNFVKKLENKALAGDTAVLRGRKGMYAWDKPLLNQEGRIYVPEENLAQGGAKKFNGSNGNSNLRYASYEEFDTGKDLSYKEFVKNPGIQALVRGKNHASRLWEVFNDYKIQRFSDKAEDAYLHGNPSRIPELKIDDGNGITLKGHASQVMPVYSSVGVRNSE